MTSQSFTKRERLKSRKLIGLLFEKGQSFYCFPFRVLALKLPQGEMPVQFGIAVPKKKIRKAVQRNLLKRRSREAFRRNKQEFYQDLNEQNKQLKQLAFVCVFAQEKMIDYVSIEQGMCAVFKTLIAEYEKIPYHDPDTTY